MPKKKSKKTKIKKRIEEVKVKTRIVRPKIKRPMEIETPLKKIAIKMFGRLADKYSKYFLALKESLLMADAKILFRTYLSLMFFITFITFLLTFLMTLVFSIYLKLDIIFTIIGLIVLPSFFASITLFLIYAYPVSTTQTRRRDIDANLPFALTHMAAVAQSGAPPITIFKILSKFEEYGEISKEAGKITRDVEVFGLDATSALREIFLKCPSSKFKDVLQGILTTIQSGGNLRAYLMEESGKAMFEYTVKRERYNQLLSVYLDLYTALLIAAPMVFIITLSILSTLGGGILGFTIDQLTNLGVIGLLFLNMVFLTFIHVTQPKL